MNQCAVKCKTFRFSLKAFTTILLFLYNKLFVKLIGGITNNLNLGLV